MTATREIWVDIKNYEGKYRISNKGRIKSLERQVSHGGITWTQPERIMSHWCGTTSYYDCVRLYKGGVGTKFSVHRLVAQHFLPEWNPKLEVNHIDGDRYTTPRTIWKCVRTNGIWNTPLRAGSNRIMERKV